MGDDLTRRYSWPCIAVNEELVANLRKAHDAVDALRGDPNRQPWYVLHDGWRERYDQACGAREAAIDALLAHLELGLAKYPHDPTEHDPPRED